MPSRRPHPVLIAGIMFGVLATAGCAVPSAPSGESGGPATSAPTSEAPPEEVTGPDCLIGDWYIAQDQLQAFYDGLSAETGGLAFTIDGGTGLSFTDTTFAYTPEFTLRLEIAGIAGTGTIVGAIAGGYTADDTTITTSQETSDVVLTVDVGGTVQDGAGLFDSFLASSPINSSPYECTAAGPVIQFSTGENRVPVQLVAR